LKQLIIILAIAACACKTTRKATTIENESVSQRDSFFVERVKFDTIKFKASAVQTKIPISLIAQPGLPVIEKKSGNATVRLKVVHDTVYAEAECDSLVKVIANYERTIERYQREQQFRKAVFDKKTTVTPWWWNIMWVVVIAFVVTALALAAWNYYKRIKPF
jgi:hypothetical protein